MWPQTLQMSEDDCRSTLRRLELETYANVMGCFRAQGGLNEKKARLLEELRGIFHISQDRHRAEARRVVNDEYLSTIAKVVSGPNTWQEWSREGRRSYPMLPRMAPHTALGWIANNLASEAALENAKLPYPTETAAAVVEEQALLAANAAADAAGFEHSEKYVVKSDPFKVPDIPAAGVKKNLKRSINDAHQYVSGSSLSKKRNTTDSQGSNKPQKNLAPISATNLLPNNRKPVNVAKLQQQRFFYQQQQKAKKLAKAAGKRSEKFTGPVKSGRKSKKLKEQLNQQILQQKEQLLQQEFSAMSYENQLMQQLGHHDSSTNNIGTLGDTAAYQDHHYQQQQNQHIEDVASDQKDSAQKSLYMPLVPQIAASKRDITRNLTKLQISGGQTAGCGQRLSAQLETNPSLIQPSTASTGSKAIVDAKTAPLSTPVQKYIVEDRQPPVPNTSNTHVATAPLTPTPQTSTTQFMSLPHLSTPNKLRALNTTSLLPPGSKLSSALSKKLIGSNTTVLSPGTSPENTTPQIFSLVDGGGGGGGGGSASVSSNSQTTPSAPTHAPPAVIQLHSNEVVRVGSQPTPSGSTPAQSKVLTTKILPIVLGGNNSSPKGGSGGTISSATNFVTNSSSSGTTIIKSLPPAMFVTSQQQQHQQQQTQHQQQSGLAGSSPVFSPFGSTGPVYRKPPNILKSSSSLSRNSASSGVPQILSNIRLTPAITTGTATSPNFSVHQTQSSTFQQQLRTGSVGSATTTGMRTSVKICQSSNGKVFIQPANVDASKLTKLPSGHMPQRIIPGTLLGNSGNLSASSGGGGSSSNQTGSPHRIAIQKVQIIPAPLSGSALGNVNQALQQQSQQQQQRLVSSSLTIGSGAGSASNKPTFSGNIFATKGSNTITLTKANFSASQNELLSGNNVGNLVTKSLSEIVGKPSNVVVLDATSASGSKILPQNTKLSTITTASSSSSLSSSSNDVSRPSLNNSQMITEDTPVDIIVDNSPHIVADTDTDLVAESSSITAVLASNVHQSPQQQPQQQQHQQIFSRHKRNTSLTPTPSVIPVAVLNATDWEMELDQATAASITHNQQSGSTLAGLGDAAIGRLNMKMQEHTRVGQMVQMGGSEVDRAEAIIIEDNYEDVIIEEEEEEEGITDHEQFDYHEEGREEDMDIEATHDAEIIMVDNRSSLFEEKSNEDFEEGISGETCDIQQTIMLNKSSFKAFSPVNEENTEDAATDESLDADADAEDATAENVSNQYECIRETVDGEHDPEESQHTDDDDEEPLREVGEINCNNHEERQKSDDDDEDDDGLNNSKASTKTTVSASLYSVKSTADSVNTNKLGEQETSIPIDISKESQSSSSDQ